MEKGEEAPEKVSAMNNESSFYILTLRYLTLRSQAAIRQHVRVKEQRSCSDPGLLLALHSPAV